MKVLDDVIEGIVNTLNRMFDKTIEAHKYAIEALVQSDNRKAVRVLEGDEKINQLEEQINYDVLIAIAKYQPVASDLRKLLAVIKIANELERIGDYAKTISKTAIVNSDETFLSHLFLKNSLEMSKINTRLLLETKEAFNNLDIDKAYTIMSSETKFTDLMYETMRNNPFSEIKVDNVDSYFLLMGALRTLERARGHIANINETTIFAVNGTFTEL